MSTENAQPTAPEPEGIDKAFADAGITDADFEPSPPVELADEPDQAEPVEQQETAAQERDEHGRFKAKAADEAAETETEPKAETAPEAKPQTDDTPPGLSDAAKAAWKDTPEAVRADVQRRFREMESGLQAYQQEYGGLKEFAQLAKSHGTTLKDALANYVGIEKALASNPKEAFEHIAKNVGVDLRQMFGAQPEGQQAQQDAQTIQGLRQELAELRRGFQGFTQRYQQTQTQQREAETMKQVEAFAAQHPRFEELGGEIAEMLKTGYATSLEDAYAKAERLHPAPQPPEPAQTRKPVANLSVAGAPGSGSNPTTRKPPANIENHLDEIFRQVGIS